jgi:hypothetical protein
MLAVASKVFSSAAGVVVCGTVSVTTGLAGLARFFADFLALAFCGRRTTLAFARAPPFLAFFAFVAFLAERLTDFFTDFFLVLLLAPLRAPRLAPLRTAFLLAFLLDFFPDFFFVAMRHLQVSPRRVDSYRTFAALFAVFDITRTAGAGA